MPLSPIKFQSNNTGKRHFTKNLFDNLSNNQKENHVINAGGFFHKLAQIVNEEITFSSSFNFIPSVPANAQLLLASATFLSTAAVHLPAIQHGSRPSDATPAVVRHPAVSFNGLSFTMLGAFNRVYNFITNIKDPLQFPLASAAALPENRFSETQVKDNSTSDERGHEEILDDKNRYVAQLVAQSVNHLENVKYTDGLCWLNPSLPVWKTKPCLKRRLPFLSRRLPAVMGFIPLKRCPPLWSPRLSMPGLARIYLAPP